MRGKCSNMSREKNCQDLVASYFQGVEKCGWNYERVLQGRNYEIRTRSNSKINLRK